MRDENQVDVNSPLDGNSRILQIRRPAFPAALG